MTILVVNIPPVPSPTLPTIITTLDQSGQIAGAPRIATTHPGSIRGIMKRTQHLAVFLALVIGAACTSGVQSQTANATAASACPINDFSKVDWTTAKVGVDAVPAPDSACLGPAQDCEAKGCIL